jgi:zinc protease
MKFLYRHAPAFPLTQVVTIFPRGGVCLDPADRQGLTRLTARMLFTGADGLDHNEYQSRLERLGANAGSALASDHATLRLVTLTGNLDAALGLFLAALRKPNLESSEFQRLRDELHSTWISDREEHKSQRVQDVYLQRIYGAGPTGYQADGTEAGILGSTIDDVRTHYGRLFGHGEPILGVLSDLPREEIERRVLARVPAFSVSGNGKPYPWDAFRPERPMGRHVTIIADAHTQTDELQAGAFSASEGDADWHIHRLIALIFGGDMNSRLFRVIRGERGFSYGASCWYESAHGHSPRDRISPFTLYTFPTVEHTGEALPLLVRLYEEFVEKGVDEEELNRAKKALIHSHAFLRDTPQKLLSLDCDEALYGIPFDDVETNRRKIAAVTPGDVLRVLRGSHHPESLTLVLLGDPKRLEAAARSIPNLAGIDVIEYPLPPAGA